MKRTLLLIVNIIAAVVLAATAASSQSGRKITTPAPSPTPETETKAPATVTERTADAPAGVRMLPESVLKHEFKSLDKESFRLSDFGGKVIVINLWATWCGPCRLEVPEYETVRKEYSSRGVEFVGLTTESPDSDTDLVKKFVREFDFRFRIGWLDRQTAVTLMNGRSVIPQTIVVAPGGRVVEHWRGYASGGRGAGMLRRAIDRALAIKTSDDAP